VPQAIPFRDEHERMEVAMIVAELDDAHPARIAYGSGRGTLGIARLVKRKDVRARLQEAHAEALQRHHKM
jgi:hypothetical protein